MAHVALGHPVLYLADELVRSSLGHAVAALTEHLMAVGDIQRDAGPMWFNAIEVWNDRTATSVAYVTAALNAAADYCDLRAGCDRSPSPPTRPPADRISAYLVH